MHTIKKIIFTLENCEVISIDSEFILDMGFEDIKRSLRMVNGTDLMDLTVCNEVGIVLKGTGDRENKPFGMELGGKVYERLRYNDITAIEVEVEGKEEPISFYVDYDEVWGSCKNKNQKTYTNKFNDLFIVIAKNKGLEDMFNMEEIDEEEYMKYYYYK